MAHLGAGILLAVLLVFDRPVFEAIRGFQNPFLDALTHGVSHLRGAAFPVIVGLLLMAGGALCSRTRIWRAGSALLLSVALSGAAVSVLKPTFARPGPGGIGVPKPGDSWIDARYGRFPSSHAAVLFSAATALAAFLPATAPVGYTVAVLVCHERVYDSTHFPSDIVAGAWLGVVLARFVIRRLSRRESWRSDLAPGWRARHPRRGERGGAWEKMGGAKAVRAAE
jgi:membrane-associated phospholipid phosphatase